jgi:hypothetical protein
MEYEWKYEWKYERMEIEMRIEMRIRMWKKKQNIKLKAEIANVCIYDWLATRLSFWQ